MDVFFAKKREEKPDGWLKLGAVGEKMLKEEEQITELKRENQKKENRLRTQAQEFNKWIREDKRVRQELGERVKSLQQSVDQLVQVVGVERERHWVEENQLLEENKRLNVELGQQREKSLKEKGEIWRTLKREREEVARLEWQVNHLKKKLKKGQEEDDKDSLI
jgi:hypothetical protein